MLHIEGGGHLDPADDIIVFLETLVPTHQTTLFSVPGSYSIHSFCSVFYDRSSAHFKISFQQNTIYCFQFNFQYSVFPLGHPIAAYVFFIFFPSLISFNNMLWPIQLSFLQLLCLEYSFPHWRCYTTSSLTWSVHLTFSTLLRHQLY